MEEKPIKSALEIALEKANRIEVSEEDLERDSDLELGKRIASDYLFKKKFNIQDIIKSYPASKRKNIFEGIESVLLMNIVLPRNKQAKKDLRKALEGIVMLKTDKTTALQFCGLIDQLADEYIKECEMNYNELKKQFEIQFETTKKAVEKELGLKVKIEVESNPEFKSQWGKMHNGILAHYNSLLAEYKTRLKTIK